MSTPSTPISGTITTEAGLPISSAADGQTATGRSGADLIAMDQHLARIAAAKMVGRGCYFTKLIPAGPVSDQGASNGLGVGFDRGGL